jgi:Kef-type K+ transport system membrane component KefB
VNPETVEVAHFLLALTVLVVMAHIGGHLFRILRQPQVIGEIAGGLLLGPTVLGRISPRAQEWLFPTDGLTADVLGAFYHLGLLLLVYLAGIELRGSGNRRERRTVLSVAVSGLVLPFTLGLCIAEIADLDGLAGPRGSATTLALVFGMAIAVTSIPVISRIMLDLGILNTTFARIVLAVAVLEDVLLYVILAVVLGVAQAETADAHGLWGMFGIDSLGLAVVYFSLVPLVFLLLLLRFGPRLFTRLSASRLNVLETRSPVAFRLVFVFLLCMGCFGLGIDPVFGALVAGLCSADREQRAARESQETLRSMSLAFFVPVYFAIVGLKLDLVRHLDVLFFCWFLVLACVVKTLSVWLGARLAGESSRSAINLAVAMNARGGPGIVLGSVTFGAGIISEDFFTSLVLLSIVTSQAAGIWLGRGMAGDRLLTSPASDVSRQPVKKGPPPSG